MLLDLPLAKTELDRAAHLRGDKAAIEKLWERSLIIDLIGDRFRSSENALEFLPVAEASGLNGERYFLGLATDGTPYFLLHRETSSTEFPENYRTLRTLGSRLNQREIGAAVHALALSQWHESHKRCAKCGESTHPTFAGAVRECAACGASHHPRTDPAVIVLIKDSADRILLGRQKVWPAKRFSTFAGFVEPGESFENCVKREVKEECGGEVVSMNYLGSQPWPFPASIMIAYEAIISNPDSVKPDGEEIEELIWLDRLEIREKTTHGELLLPPSISVARAMINAWYGTNAKDELQGGESWRN